MSTDCQIQNSGARGRQESNNHPSTSLESLLRDLIYFDHLALAQSSRKVYDTAHNQFLSFCTAMHFVPYPVNEDCLRLFAVSLARRVSPNTIQVYLSSLRFFNIQMNHGYPFPSMPCLKLLLRGIKQGIGKQPRKPPRLPITITALRFIQSVIKSSLLSTYDQVMLWSACCLAFFGFLWGSEFTAPLPNSYLPGCTLLVSDINTGIDSQLYVRVKMSKDDPFRQGHVLLIAPTNTPICAMRFFLQCRGNSPGPLFKFANGTFLTRNKMNFFIKSWLSPLHLDTNRFSSHSFPIGAASTAAAAGLPSWLIQALGRWSSQCYIRYVRMFPLTISAVPRQLVQVHLLNSVWAQEPNCL